MCGIAGIINFDDRPIDEHVLHQMNDFMKQRGPDGQGYWQEKNIGFAHRRLSIIDLSDKARQPMLDEKEYAVVTYNGELYNYRALRDELLKQKIHFFSESDTEVIINACLHWGVKEFLNRAQGMFAFVLFNRKTNVIYFCRDRFGKKPLYYYKNSEGVLFASDIRAIRSVANNLTLDLDSIDYYLSELSMPQPRTIWNEVKQVSPACFLTIDVVNKTIVEENYKKVNFQNKIDISLDNAIISVEELLKNAVLKRTVSDVPIGCFLSGGADSGLVTAMLALNSNSRINTFTVGFTYSEFDELPLAQQLAERYNTQHTAIIVDTNILDDVESIINYFGEPFADSSMIPSYYIAKEIGKKVKVALSGDGGDEVFGGYHEYATAYNSDKYYRENKSVIKRMIMRGGNMLAYKLKLTDLNYGHLQHYYRLAPDERLYREMGFNNAEKRKLYSPNSFFLSSLGYTEGYFNEKWTSSNQVSLTDTLFETSFKTRLLNDYLVKIDRTSMMNSVEVRSPFLDGELVDFVAQLPNHIKLHNGIRKYILKKLSEKYINKDFFKRKKQGFGAPIKYWLNKELKDFTSDMLESKSMKDSGLFNNMYIGNLIKEHRENKHDNSSKLWALLSLAVWLRSENFAVIK